MKFCMRGVIRHTSYVIRHTSYVIRHSVFLGLLTLLATSGSFFAIYDVHAANPYLYHILETGQSLAARADKDPTYFMSRVMRQKFLMSIDNAPTLSNHAQGGYTYAQLKKGTTPYTQGMAQLNAVHNQAAAEGRIHHVVGVTNMHGESDDAAGVSAETYKSYLVEWQRDYETDVKAVTGQTGTVPMFTCQQSSFSSDYIHHTHPVVTLAQLAAAEENPGKIFLVGPKYFLNYGDQLHLDETNDGRFGSKLWSEYYAKVVDAVFNQHVQWKPLSPRDIVRSGAHIYVRFHIPHRATKVVFDTTNVSAMPNMGFEYADSTTSATISDVSIVSDDTVRITLNKTPTGTNQRVMYAYTGVINSQTGAHGAGSPKGNVRDDDRSVATFDNSVRLYNWLVHFAKPMRVDETPPQITLNGTYATQSTNATFTFSANEEATIQCSLDSAAFTPCANTQSYTNLAQGAHQFRVKAIDSAYNETTRSLQWTVDTVAPRTTLSFSPASPTTSTTADFTFSANEQATFRCSLDNAAFTACSSPLRFTNLGRGTHTLRIQASDQAGNVETPAYTYTWSIVENVAVQVIGATPQGTLPTGTRMTSIIAETNVNATCRYAIVAETAYASMSSTMQVTGGKKHTTPITGLEDGKAYTFFLRCQDGTGAVMTADYRVAFSVLSATPPPWNNPDPVEPSTPPVPPVSDPQTPSTPPVSAPDVDDTFEDTRRIKIDFDGKRRSFTLSSRKTLYVNDRQVTFYGTAPRIAGGSVSYDADRKVNTTVAADGTWSMDVTLKKNKKHKVKIVYYDNRGTEVGADTYTIRIDTEKPVITDLPDVLHKNPGEKVWWSAKDNDEVKRYKYAVWGRIRRTQDNHFYLPHNISKGVHGVQVRVYDRAGNKTTKNIRVIIQ